MAQFILKVENVQNGTELMRAFEVTDILPATNLLLGWLDYSPFTDTERASMALDWAEAVMYGCVCGRRDCQNVILEYSVGDEEITYAYVA